MNTTTKTFPLEPIEKASIDELRALQLNAFKPIIAHSLNREYLRSTVTNSIGIVTALNPYIGYANATSVAQEAHATGGSVYDIVLQRGLLGKEQLDQLLQPEVLTRPTPLNLPKQG